MNQLLADLLKVLTLERIEINLFRGESRDIGSAQVFGGQVLGQSLVAASGTIEGRDVHSLHAYFLRRGDFKLPIVYEVDRARDGRHFSTRRVVAIQNGEPIFNMSASFQTPEDGLEHQMDPPAVAPPEELLDLQAHIQEAISHVPERMRKILGRARPFEFRPVELHDYRNPHKTPGRRNVWFRAVGALPQNQALHRCLLAYVSDYALLETALMPHGITSMSQSVIMASIDHAMWFHRDVKLDEWLLYSTDSPSASGARGFARGSVYTRDGRLVASTAQEGLMRIVEAK
jgi:acyl-CoA thioesterase II